MRSLKQCSKCKQWKSPDKFYRDRSTQQGRRSQCKACCAEYQQSMAGRVVQRRYARSEKRRQSVLRYVHSEKGHETGRKAYQRWYQTEKGQQYWRKRNPEYRKAYPKKVQAVDAVNNAVRDGKIPPISMQNCAKCGGQAQHYHHPDYNQPFEVVPLCTFCHSSCHQN